MGGVHNCDDCDENTLIYETFYMRITYKKFKRTPYFRRNRRTQPVAPSAIASSSSSDIAANFELSALPGADTSTVRRSGA